MYTNTELDEEAEHQNNYKQTHFEFLTGIQRGSINLNH